MFSVNDHVFYNAAGVCQVADVKVVELGSAGRQECYVLKVVANPRSVIYVPVAQADASGSMRPLLTKEEVHGLIDDMPEEESIWISDARERSREFSAAIRTCDSRTLVRLIKTLYLQKSLNKKKGKALNVADGRIMDAAEKLLYDEFAFVLGIQPDDVVPFIRGRIPQGAL